MNYIRATREEAFEPTGFSGYTIQMLAHPESATFINSRVLAGGHAADLHVHDADQIYFVVDGEMQVDLGESRHRAGSGSLVYIPAGLPHRNWNEGPDTEFHFEIIVPSARPGRPLLALVDDPVPSLDIEAGYVALAQPPPAAELSLQRLTAPAARAEVSVCDEPAGSPAVDRHTHEFDQFYYVLRGTLAVEVDGTEHDIAERTLVMMPAGVPHRSGNKSAAPVRYLVVNIPAPEKAAN
jgi:mannose-6-phosphate isomerase-like protein (cupin superfamily)